jgi:signal recognition particle GTPase
MKVDSGKKPGEQFIALLAQELVDTMGAAQTPLTRRSDGRPNIILMAGLQGRLTYSLTYLLTQLLIRLHRCW